MSAEQSPLALVLQVPTLNDDRSDFVTLFHLWQQVQDLDPPKVVFDFSTCRFLRQNAVAFLGGLARLVQSRGGRVHFVWESLQPNIRANLHQNEFLRAFGASQEGGQGNSVPYREYACEDMDQIALYLEDCWLREWVQTNPDARSEIVMNALEVYSNAFEHSASEIGVFTCGQRYPSLGQVHLTVLDFGVGIPPNVRHFRNRPDILAEEALSWAFQLGTTTRADKVAGGTGLNTLKQFVQEKCGKIEVYSHDGYALVSGDRELYRSAPTFFGGTLINIIVRCDLPGLQLTGF